MPEARPNPEVVEAARSACATTREWATLAVKAAEPLIRQQVLEELLSDEVVEALAERSAIHELWGWWEDVPTREAKEGRQRKRYAALREDVKDSWRKGARDQLQVAIDRLSKLLSEEGS